MMRFLNLTSVILASLFHSVVMAEESPPWYKVEVLIFQYTSPTASSLETWPSVTELHYPAGVRTLNEAIEAPLELPDPWFYFWQPSQQVEEVIPPEDSNLSVQEPAPDSAFSDQASVAQSDQPANTNESVATTDSPAEHPDVNEAASTLGPIVLDAELLAPLPPLRPAAFERLDNDLMQLSSAWAHLRRLAGYRPVFHSAWLQPALPRGQAQAVAIQAGEEFGNHHTIEGSIRFSAERYLHVDLDLWLHQFTADFGQTPPVEVELSPYHENLPVALQQVDHQPASAGYLVSSSVVVQQSRRMRSNEIHYLDHPLLGVIIVATPFKEPSTD